MSKYPESRTRGLVKMKALGEREASAVYRVRASTEVHDWLSRMTAEQRGEMLARVLAAQLTVPVSAEKWQQGVEIAPRPQPEEERRGEARPLRLLVSGRLPSGLSQPAIDLIHQLQAGDSLTLEGGRYWLTSRHTGEKSRPSSRMVAALLARELVG